MHKALCDCSDRGCPIHRGDDDCPNFATTVLYRVDMSDTSGTNMCQGCAEDAMGAGVFTTEEPGEE